MSRKKTDLKEAIQTENIYIYVNKECGQQERPKNIEKWYHIATLQQMKGAMAEDKSFHQMLSKKSLVI